MSIKEWRRCEATPSTSKANKEKKEFSLKNLHMSFFFRTFAPDFGKRAFVGPEP